MYPGLQAWCVFMSQGLSVLSPLAQPCGAQLNRLVGLPPSAMLLQDVGLMLYSLTTYLESSANHIMCTSSNCYYLDAFDMLSVS
jgi:hypothetical protein